MARIMVRRPANLSGGPSETPDQVGASTPGQPQTSNRQIDLGTFDSYVPDSLIPEGCVTASDGLLAPVKQRVVAIVKLVTQNAVLAGDVISTATATPTGPVVTPTASVTTTGPNATTLPNTGTSNRGGGAGMLWLVLLAAGALAAMISLRKRTA